MTNEPTLPIKSTKLQPRIVVLGIGGAGGNAVNNMIRSNLEGVECMVANTDAQALSLSQAERKIQLGLSLTQGLGAGARPEIGRAAAEEGVEEIIQHLQGCHMVFLTAGMGGGTGTGAAPVIARAARELGILTVGVVTKPFHFEGVQRMHIADAGIDELEQVVDTLIVIPNQNLFRIANEHTTFADAFKMADDVLYSGVRGVTDLMVMPGLINLDFADIRTVMSEMGKAMMGAGEAEGENRAVAAAEAAISNPLLDDVSMKGAQGVLINITGGSDMTLYEVDEAANRIRDEIDPNANIIFGSTFDDSMQGHMRVSVFATGISSAVASEPKPITIRVISQDGHITSPAVARPSTATPRNDTFAPVANAPAIEAPAVEAPAVEAPATPTATPAADESATGKTGAGNPAASNSVPGETATAVGFSSSRKAAAKRTKVERVEPRFGPSPSVTTRSRSGGFLASATAAVARVISPAPAPISPPLTEELPQEDGFEAFADAAASLEGGKPAAEEPVAAESLFVEEPSFVEEPVVAPAPNVVETPAAGPPAAGPTPLAAATAEQNEEELLEIPAFLRRQAN